jgi:Flp pilus assembly pilin Flp
MAKKNAAINHRVRDLKRDVRGLSTVEYIIILMLIAIVGIAAWNQFGAAVKEKIESASGSVEGLPTS